ncbi:MAG: phosphate--AMP phosphotransferase, partial [bacterium]
MLEKLDLAQKLPKGQFKPLTSELEMKLAALQRKAIQLKIPILIVFEGWGAAGKGTSINRLILTLDPRHFTVYNIQKPNEEEIYRPFLWRYWTRTPAKGRMAIFDNSWYTRVIGDRVDKIVGPQEWTHGYSEINSYERQLTNDGNIIIKFFLHISKKEQKRRFKQLENNSSTAWRVTKNDWRQNKKYDRYIIAIEDMLAKTDTGYAPWTIVEANDRRFATIKIFQTVIHRLENSIAEYSKRKKGSKTKPKRQDEISSFSSTVLDKVDLSVSLSREDYFKQLKKYQGRVRDLEHEVYINRMPVIILYEGWDAGGKGGNIKRLTQKMDPRGYEVIPIAAPN